MSANPWAISPLQLDGSGRIAEDLLCSRCEYNLRGLVRAPDAVCPECGLPVERSVRGDLARSADPRWITRLASGLRWVFIGMLVASIAGAAMQIVGLVVWGRMLGLVRAMPREIGHLAIIAAVTPSLYGFWMATAPERHAADRLRFIDARRIARWTLPLAIALWPTWIWHTDPPSSWTLRVEIASDLLMLVGLFATFSYGQQLARRMPDVRLARQTRWCLWLAVLGYVLAAAFRAPWGPMLLNLPWRGSLPASSTLIHAGKLVFRAGVELALSVIGLSVFWLLLLLAWYRHRLRDAAKVAAARLAAA